MSTIELLEPILEGGITNTHFFNGRLLTGEDLQDQQKANQECFRQLVRSLGEGVLAGMEVSLLSTGSLPTVSITKGMAMNREGQVLELKEDIDLKLIRKSSSPGSGGGKNVFAPCQVKSPHLVPTGTGVYILAAAPASGYQGRAPMHHIEDNGKISDCGYKYQVEGLQFKLVFMDITNTSIAGGSIGEEIRELVHNTDLCNRSKLRNLLAHLCLGTEPAAAFTADLFGSSGSSAAASEYGPVDALRKIKLLDSTDVPLALILWTVDGLEFVDMWPVRRSVFSPYIFKNTSYPVTDRRTAELEAAYLQFQDHIQTIFNSSLQKSELSYLQAGEYFRYLPSVGIIPIKIEQSLQGFLHEHFFKGLKCRGAVIEGVKLKPLVNLSFSYEPIDLEEKEFTWLYGIRQNFGLGEIIKESDPSSLWQAYGVFASGYIPFQGEAQFNLSRFNNSSYSPGVARNIFR